MKNRTARGQADATIPHPASRHSVEHEPGSDGDQTKPAIKVRPVDVARARLQVTADKRLGRETPDLIKRIAAAG